MIIRPPIFVILPAASYRPHPIASMRCESSRRLVRLIMISTFCEIKSPYHRNSPAKIFGSVVSKVDGSIAAAPPAKTIHAVTSTVARKFCSTIQGRLLDLTISSRQLVARGQDRRKNGETMTTTNGSGKPTTFTIDDREIDIREGETIFRAARRLDIKLPHLCYSPKPGYRPDGNCRVCMVEIEGERVLAASCIRMPTPGMKVKTQTDRAKTARRMVAELLVADQPALEIAHDPDSELWKVAKRQNIKPGRFPRDSRPTLDRSHPAMAVNLDACIHCNLCVRACREVQVNDVIGMSGRGHHAKIVFDFDDPMGASTCVACGECVQACPTGALMPSTLVDEHNVFTGKPDREVHSVCPYCGVGCQLTYHIKDDKLLYVSGRDGPANQNRLCVK